MSQIALYIFGGAIFLMAAPMLVPGRVAGRWERLSVSAMPVFWLFALAWGLAFAKVKRSDAMPWQAHTSLFVIAFVAYGIWRVAANNHARGRTMVFAAINLILVSGAALWGGLLISHFS